MSDAPSPTTAEQSEAAVPEAELSAYVEAAVFASDRPLTPARLAEALGATIKAVGDAVDKLNEQYEASGRSFRIERVANGLQVLTLPRFSPVLERVNRSKAQNKLSPAAMETLAIVAYKQPIVRAEVEAIRGVACGETLRSLLDRGLIRITGRAEELGRPMLYGTTTTFLTTFGLASLKDLPKAEDFGKAGAGG